MYKVRDREIEKMQMKLMLMLDEKQLLTKRRDQLFAAMTELEVERRRFLSDIGEYTKMMGA